MLNKPNDDSSPKQIELLRIGNISEERRLSCHIASQIENLNKTWFFVEHHKYCNVLSLHSSLLNIWLLHLHGSQTASVVPQDIEAECLMRTTHIPGNVTEIPGTEEPAKGP